MRFAQPKCRRVPILSWRFGALLGVLVVGGLLFAAPASAGFEQVDSFAEGIGTDYLPTAESIAVNTTGAGGVPAGTAYGVAGSPARYGIFRYSAKGEYLGLWREDFSVKGLAIDQSTGYVYVFRNASKGENTVKVFSADGSELIASFGEMGSSAESFEESPESLHFTVWPSGIAVDGSGTVYISDNTFNGTSLRRVMVWKPQSPGDYEHYVYAGRANDIDTVGHLATDDAGSLYSAISGEIEEFAPGEPTTPVCKYEVSDDGLSGMTVNPTNGQVFYYDYKDKKTHQLAACNGQGEFEEGDTFTLTPKPTGLVAALGFNPSLAWEASRPPGALYAVDNSSGRGYIFAPAEVRFPAVESEQVSSVTATTAELQAQINPKGSAVHYVFQYLTRAAYEANPPGERFAGASEAPLGGSSLPASQEALSAAASLVGLQTDTEYRYRVIAASNCEPEDEEKACEDTGEAEGFRTFPDEAPGLPDHRAWELVSPAQKNGGEVFPANHVPASTEPGGGIATFALQSSPDGEAVAYEGFPFSASEGAAIANEYLSRRSAAGWQTTALSPTLLSGKGAAGGHAVFDPALSHDLVLQQYPSLTPGAPFEYANLYAQAADSPLSLAPLVGSEPPNRAVSSVSNGFQLLYAGASEDLSHVFFAANDALTGETPFAPEAVDGGAAIDTQANLYEWVGGQLRLVNVLPGNAETVPGARFGYALGSASLDPGHAISADGSRAYWSDNAGQLYVRIDGESTVEIPDAGKFLTASEDGSKVLLDDGHLYDLQTEALTDLSEGQGGFRGIAGQSDDLSQIYFVDTAVLTGEEENEHGAKAQAGKDNLYARHEGQLAFVATLAAGDAGFEGEGVLSRTPSRRYAEASPDGRWLTFLSREPLSGYESVGFPQQAFLYDSQSGKLICASCNRSGARPLGATQFPIVREFYLPQLRYLLDSGRLYFDSRDSLTPSDTNQGAEDVYEYEPQGVGTCEREGGCVSLISAGHEPGNSSFLALDETGKSVFFVTRDQLVLKDRDDLMDLYVAREGGGLASETETARGECQGEACQAQVSPPNDPTPGSSAFEGAGNVVEPAAKKHRKHHKHRHKAKRHRHERAAKHNRGGAR